ncbi:MAG: hypothetical protein JO249_06700 [Acidobacteria bacterium]|nr:hypothetical protein [Acidobacteriota bacterium]
MPPTITVASGYGDLPLPKPLTGAILLSKYQEWDESWLKAVYLGKR